MRIPLFLTDTSAFRALENPCLEFLSHLKVMQGPHSFNHDPFHFYQKHLSGHCRDSNPNQVKKQASYTEYSLLGACDQKLRRVRETIERKPCSVGGPGRKTAWAQILTPPLTVCRTSVSVFTSLCLNLHTCIMGITKCLSYGF